MTSEPFDPEKRLHELRQLRQELEYQQQLREKTERHAGELAARLQQMLHTTLDGYILADAEGRIKDVNPSYCRMIGYSREELLRMDLGQIECVETREQIKEHIRQVVAAGSSRFETKHRRKDGRVIDVDVSVTAFLSPEEGLHVGAFIRDITEEKRTRRHLETQNAILRVLTSSDSLSDALAKLIEHVEKLGNGAIGSVWLIDESARKFVLGAGPRLPAEFVRKVNGFEVAPTTSVCGAAVSAKRRVVARDLIRDSRAKLYAELAERFNLRASWSQPILSTDGKVLGTFAFYYPEPKEPTEEEIELIEMAADLAGLAIERWRYLQALKESEQRFRQLASLTQEGVVVHVEGEIIDANEAFAKMFGYEVEELIGQHLRRFTAPTTPDQPGRTADLLTGESYTGPCVRKDGSTFLAHATGRSVVYHGKPACVLSVRDVTEQKMAERERERLINELRAKNSELELFTQAVSHDLRGPLVTAKGFLSHLRHDLEHNAAAVEEDLEHIQRALERMDEMLTDLLRLSQVGRAVGPMEDIPAGRLVAEAIERLKQQIKEAGTLIVVHPGLPTVRGDVSRLVQVVQNLLENAIKFSRNESAPLVEIRGWHEGDRAILEVRDNGVGLRPEERERVFEVFHRVERDSPGSGIGLAICKRIVEAHGGRIWAESEGPARGARFLVELPAPETEC